MKNYVGYMRRKPIEAFADANWYRLGKTDRYQAIIAVVQDYSKLIGIEPPIVIPSSDYIGNNAEYYLDREYHGQKLHNVIFISEECLNADQQMEPFPLHRPILHNGMAEFNSLIHECTHARDFKAMEDDAAGILPFEYLDVSDVPNTVEQLRASVGSGKIKTHVDNSKHFVRLYPQVKPDDVWNNHFKWAMYIFNPFEQSARSAAENITIQCLEIWRKADPGMNISRADIEALNMGDTDSLMFEAKYVIDKLNYPDKEGMKNRLEKEWPDSIDEMFIEFGKAYAGEPDQDIRLGSLVRMQIRAQAGQVYGVDLTGEKSVKEEEKYLQHQVKWHKRTVTHVTTHAQKMAQLDASSISNIQNPDDADCLKDDDQMESDV